MDDLHEFISDDLIWEDLDRTESLLLEAVISEDDYLTKIAQHLLLAGGKRFRPLLALLASRFGPADDHRRLRAGVAVELIHVGSLYHDDVIDQADTRRGAPSVNVNWSNTVAILAGDFLMARASELAATHLSLESVRLLAATYAELVEGQTRELRLVDSLGHPVSAYETVIGGKTASLIRTSARLGAMSSDAEPHVVEALSTWAWELGMVFQIVDDALDLVATEETLGKPAGSDIREGTFTQAVLEAAHGPDGERIRNLLDRPRPFPDANVAEVIDLVREGGFVDRALESALGGVQRARDALSVLPPNPTRETLAALGEYLVARVNAART
ncbi:MAG TPA: polyprenyl synthetase family protein [Acidimicrobiia bacterium]|nr:polyprenyl synthetase family protein [Acidimicrobiia bacterium]